LVRPEPRIAGVSVRTALLSDGPFIDALQKMHTHMVGWFPRKQLEVYIEAEHVLIAEDDAQSPLGYCIAKDRYMKRDDVGIIYQLNILPLAHRKLIGAALVKATFERAAYGCRLFSCWCAQDLQANWFWESIGFVPLAFRTGSRGKQRIHIFWQRRIREGDDATPYWFPSQTQAGAVREDRLVFPIPPGTHWRDAKPVVLPGFEPQLTVEDRKWLPPARPNAGTRKGRASGGGEKMSHARKLEVIRSKSKHLKGVPKGKASVVTAGGIKYVDRSDAEPPEEAPKKAKAPKKPRPKNDPKMVEAVRELRDRFLDEVNSGRLLPGGECQGKYDVSRPRLLDPRMADPRMADPRMAEGSTQFTEKIRRLDAA
jgi:GNAT superfamily N-acetyltransferase